jgi:hypothetical protein
MKRMKFRRWRNTLVTLGLALFVVSLGMLVTTTNRGAARLSGWCLLLMIAVLASYNLRKKLSVLPLGAAATWLQFHIYTGWLTAVVFGVHISWRMPTGVFESLLASLYGGVFLSGVFGLFVSRSFARRLTTRGDEIIFERIPAYRKYIETQVEEIVLACQESSDSTTVPMFYAERLKPFFAQTCHVWHHLMQSNRPRRTLLREVEAQQRYLDAAERDAMSEIADCIKRKDDLDYQYSLQATLKYWLFAHVPLTYALLVFVVFHLLLVQAFAGAGS